MNQSAANELKGPPYGLRSASASTLDSQPGNPIVTIHTFPPRFTPVSCGVINGDFTPSAAASLCRSLIELAAND